jgi:hypothetical protein
MPGSIQNLGDVALLEGDVEQARALYEESLVTSRATDNQGGVSMSLRRLGFALLRQGDLNRAAGLFLEGLKLNQDRAFALGLMRYLPAFAALAVARGQPERAARLLGASQALLEARGVRLEPVDAAEFKRTEAVSRAQLDAATVDSLWAEGRVLPLEQAAAYALEAALTDE